MLGQRGPFHRGRFVAATPFEAIAEAKPAPVAAVAAVAPEVAAVKEAEAAPAARRPGDLGRRPGRPRKNP
jgi:uncharacterized protein (DUF58 family)